MSLRIGSLFTGAGGLDMAVQSVVGGELAWYSEIDKDACRVLEAHHPDVRNLGDVTVVDWTSVEPVDVLTAGYPCQPFSTAGRRKGADDDRHLWPWIVTALRAGILRPGGVVVLENVAGHLSLGLADVLLDLAALGFDARWGVVRASDAGAPHKRARVFILAWPTDTDGGQLTRPSTEGRVSVAAERGTRSREQPERSSREQLAADTTGQRLDRDRSARGRWDGLAHDGQSLADSEGVEQREPVIGMGERTEPRRSRGAASDTDRDGYGGGRTPDEWADWTEAMKDKHANGNGHGRSLEQEAMSIGASTSPQSDAGKRSPDQPQGQLW